MLLSVHVQLVHGRTSGQGTRGGWLTQENSTSPSLFLSLIRFSSTSSGNFFKVSAAFRGVAITRRQCASTLAASFRQETVTASRFVGPGPAPSPTTTAPATACLGAEKCRVRATLQGVTRHWRSMILLVLLCAYTLRTYQARRVLTSL